MVSEAGKEASLTREDGIVVKQVMNSEELIRCLIKGILLRYNLIIRNLLKTFLANHACLYTQYKDRLLFIMHPHNFGIIFFIPFHVPTENIFLIS